MEVNRRYCTEIILGIRVCFGFFCLQKEREPSGSPALNACLGKNPTETQIPTEAFKGCEHLASRVMGKGKLLFFAVGKKHLQDLTSLF